MKFFFEIYIIIYFFVYSINKCKNYYEVFGVIKDVGDEDLKKVYRKFVLKFYLDKNYVFGVIDVFKSKVNFLK